MMEGGVIAFSISGLQTRLNNSNHDGDDKKELSKRIHFLLCESCFWCASYISSKSVSVAKCPNCNNNKIEWMPISKVDVDKLSHSPKGAIELHNSTALQHSQSGDHR
ncbi:MAG: hypothetical protein ACJ72R_17560 [Nitrososphaeraceae archaeon]|jgi:hypothetical protein